MNDRKEREELVLTAYSYVKKLMAGVDAIIEGVEAEPAKHLENMAQAMDGIKWLTDAVRLTEGLHGLEIDKGETLSQLQEVVDACENSDYHYMAELLTNETMPMLCDWLDALEEAVEALDGGEGGV